MFQADIEDLHGDFLCIFPLEIRSLPLDPNVELSVTSCIYYTADTMQKIAIGIGTYNFTNFDMLANELEENLMRQQNAMLYPYLKNRTVVEGDDQFCWYNVIIPDANVANTIRNILTRDELVRLRGHIVAVVRLLKELSDINSLHRFQQLMYELKFELFGLHILDQQARER